MRRSDPTRWACWEVDAAGVLLCAALSLTAYFAAVRPLMIRRELFAKKENQLRMKRHEASRLTTAQLAYRNELASVHKELAENRISLRPSGYVNRQVASLTELINQCGLEADSIELGKARKGARYNTVPITLAGRGGYENSLRFLRRLSEAFPDTGVGSFRISGNPAKPQDPGRFRFGLLWHAAPAARMRPK